MNARKGLGLGHFLNAASQEASQEEHKADGAAKVLSVDIKDLKFNPKNFYGLRDIDELANQIELSHVVEPLSVEWNPDAGKDGEPNYIILAGHRRFCAWKKLLEEGKVTDTTLPCIVRTFKPWQIGDKVIEPEKIAEAYLMYSNMGQRKNLTVDEQIAEVEHLEPLARELFSTKPEGNRGNFRTFFAKEILGIPETVLQRRLSLRKLTPNVKEAIDKGVLSITCGAELGALEPEKQEAYLKSVQAGERKGTLEEIREIKREQRKAASEVPEVPSEPEESETAEVPDEPDEPDEPEEASAEDFQSDGASEPDEPGEEPDDEPEEAQKDEEPSVAEEKPVEPKTSLTIRITDVPKNFSDPQKEANDWVVREQKKTLERLLEYAQSQSKAYENTDKLVSTQWHIRASAIQVKLLMLDRTQDSKL